MDFSTVTSGLPLAEYSPTQYDHESDYLDDLRVKWKEYYDPSDMYDVDPSDYDNEGDYMDAIQNYIKMKMK